MAAWSAPGTLIAGWAIGAALQPPGYSAVRDTISALAAHGATDRWVMSAALVGVGVSYLVVALGLHAAPSRGRAVLAIGGVATCLVAAFAQPAHGNSVTHTIAAAFAFLALATWPIIAGRRTARSPLLSCGISRAASAVLLGLVVWFALEIHGDQRGLAERVAATAQALWPLLVVISVRRSQRVNTTDRRKPQLAETRST